MEYLLGCNFLIHMSKQVERAGCKLFPLSRKKFTASGLHLPKYEYEQYEEREEDSDIVYGSEHDEELTAQLGHEAHQLEDAQ